MNLVGILSRNLKNPIFWFGIGMIVFCFLRFNRQEKLTTIRSDASGYYAYLPAIFTYNDPTFSKPIAAELHNSGSEYPSDYLVKTADGEIHNKYFPGVAFLQSPFYFLATGVSFLTGAPTDGYSYYYQLFFELGGLFYALLGLFLLSKFLARLHPDFGHTLKWIVPILYLSTPLFHYSINTLSFSHGYSIALFALFGLAVLKLKKAPAPINFLKAGLVLGLIFLVRPTNMVILLTVPYIVGGWNETRNLFRSGFAASGIQRFYGIIGFVSIAILVLFVWKWDTGNFVIWSYRNEGFNFSEPHLIESLFSFRAGIFVHTPILFLCIFALITTFRRSPTTIIFWFLYFVINAWIISSWWCWDYETAFNHRPFAEHFVFMILPLIPLLKKKNFLVYSLLGLCFIIGSIRVYSIYNGSITNQRFTSENYFSSLLFWKDSNFQRWQFTRSCEPYGQCVVRTQIFRHEGILKIKENDTISCKGSMILNTSQPPGRYYFRVLLDKKVNAVPFDSAVLTITATDTSGEEKYRYQVPLYNDKYEGLNQWKELIFEGWIPDNLYQLRNLEIHIANPGRASFQLRDVAIDVGLYTKIDPDKSSLLGKSGT